ncbi:MAG TPA: heavy metal translocating P-type ATPase metal-binding domain-containing protein [Bacteroidia bacterium]|nr:heavy metal translocating P-type ATPase metal-binding domain-containing protein [Bacteroidia bacterium]
MNVINKLKKLKTLRQDNSLENLSINEKHCFHCKGELPKIPLQKDNHLFCCKGCVSVYSLIKDAGLNDIYNHSDLGSFTKPVDDTTISEFEYLENPAIQEKIISFKEGNIFKVMLYAPDIHCASCIWLLEHLPQLHSGVIQSQVNFHTKKISVIYDNSKITLKQLAILLTQIGYKPYFSLEKKDNDVEQKKLLMQLGVAGFAFGNIMLLSFPDYLDSLSTLEVRYSNLFHYVSFVLSLPVLFFSANPYLKSAWSGIKAKDLNMDIPIAIGILTLFFRSSYDVFIEGTSGYFDSLSGFIFFLLIGRWYQHKTYKFLDFDKSLHSFFPISVIKIENLNEVVKEVKEILENDIVKLRNGELIPFDGILLSNEAQIDYSFVTGEAEIFKKQKGDLLYTGGKLLGQSILVKVKKPFNQQYFIELWNENTQRKNYEYKKISSFLGKFITTLVLTTALVAIIYWRNEEISTILKIVTSILIIGCSCAFALSPSFLFGNVSRVLSRISFFIKNADSIVTLSKVNHIVLDKTGTMTEKGFSAQWYGKRELAENDYNLLYAVFQNSFHPLSKKITNEIKDYITHYYETTYYNEYPGKGIEAIVNDNKIRAGSKEWLNIKDDVNTENSTVYIEINDEVIGYFSVQNKIRDGISNLNELINEGYQLHILTGDNSQRTEKIKQLFNKPISIFTQQKPEDKKHYIENLQKQNKAIVLMIGDGLNDMPALKVADFGISVTDDNTYFAPSGDAIMKGENIRLLPNILRYSKLAYKLLIASYVFSFMYNAIGLYLAFNGYLNPLVAAVFMPFSSISVVLFAIFSTNYFAKKFGFKA